MGAFDRIYGHSPVVLQNLMVSVYGAYWHWLRFGGDYPLHEKNYQTREKFSASEWKAYQQDQLKQLLTACLSIPYYREHWNDQQKQAAVNGDLSMLPILDKSEIRSHELDFCLQNHKAGKIYTFHTSGSSGTPIATRWTKSEIRNSLALREVRSANWAGVSFTQPRATFSGRMVEPDPNSKGPFHRFNSIEKQVYFSAFHLKPENAQKYVDALWKHQVQWMTGYAVSYYLLAQYILDQDIQIPPIKAVITTSEKLTEKMRDLMQKAYQCRIYEEYSTVENAVFASECECGKLHVSPDAGIIEILRPDGSSCEPGEAGEVIATCLMRHHQPFIRFRLGDLAAWDEEPCACGRAMPVIKEVVGRIEDVVIGPDGRKLVRFHGIFTDQPHVVEGQIIQESINHVIVKVVATEDFSDHDRMDIMSRVQQRLTQQVAVDVQLVDAIPRTKAGKFKAVISHVKSDN